MNSHVNNYYYHIMNNKPHEYCSNNNCDICKDYDLSGDEE